VCLSLKFSVSERQMLFVVIVLLLLSNVLFYLDAITSTARANKMVYEFNLVLDSNYCVFPERVFGEKDFDFLEKFG